MKKFITALIILLAGFLIGIAGYKIALEQDWLPAKDQIEAEYVQDEQLGYNTEFTSVNEILVCQSDDIEEFTIDSVFRSMPPTTLMNVASTCIKRNGCVTIKSAVEEYRANTLIYDSVITSPTPTTTAESTTVPEEGSPKIRSDTAAETNYQFVDTIINGEHRRIVKTS